MERRMRGWRCVVLSMLTAMQCGIDAGPGPNELAAAWPVEELAAAGGWLRAGEALEEQNLADLALEAFLVAARLAPALPIPHERMGAILEMRFGDPDGAAPHYERAIRRGSVHARSHYLLGNFAASQGKHARAATLHRAAVEIDQHFFEAHNNLGTALINLANLANQTRIREVCRRDVRAYVRACGRSILSTKCGVCDPVCRCVTISAARSIAWPQPSRCSPLMMFLFARP